MAKKEVAIALVGAGVLTALMFWRKKPPEEEEGEGADIQIEILDAEGNPVPRGNSLTLSEGGSYTLTVRVTNTTRRAGVPWPAELRVQIGLTLGSPMTGQGLINYNETLWFGDGIDPFLPEIMRVFQFPFTIPSPAEWDYGVTGVAVFDPAGNMLAQASEDLVITLFEIVYGATVDIIGV